MVTALLVPPPPPWTTGIGELAAGEEAGFLAVARDQVRLRQALEQALVLQRAHDAAEAFLGVEHEEVQEVAEDEACRPRSHSGAENCCVVVRPNQSFLKPLRDRTMTPSSCSALRLTSAKRTFSMTWLEADAFLLPQQVDDVLLLLDVAGGDVAGLLHHVLAGDGAGDDDVLAAAAHFNHLAREELLHVIGERGEVAANLHFVGLDRARRGPTRTARSCPAVCRGSAAASAPSPSRRRCRAPSATRGRSCDPTFRIVDRPTSRSMSVGASAGGGCGAPVETDGENAGVCCACGAATRMTMMHTTSAAMRGRPLAGRQHDAASGEAQSCMPKSFWVPLESANGVHSSLVATFPG